MKPTLYIAPIKGITDSIYHHIYNKHFQGFHGALTPFLSTKKQDALKNKYLKEHSPLKEGSFTVIPQILSNDADFFLSIAIPLSQRGYNEINWNLGCPYPTAVNRSKGAGLLPQKEKILSFLEKTTTNKDFSLSIKCRLGLVDPDEILELIPTFNEFKLNQIIIHPRTAPEMYDGDLHLDIFKECVKELKHPVVYNGDIFTIEDFNKTNDSLKDQQTYMLGRGAVIDPFLPEKILNIFESNEDEEKKRFQNFHHDLFFRLRDKLSGDKHLLDKMKSFWIYWSQNYEDSRKTMKKIKKISSIENYKKAVEEITAH